MTEKSTRKNGLSEEAYRLIDKEIAKYPQGKKESAVIAALAIAQREHGFVGQDLEKEIAAYLEMEEISVHEILTFYNMFNKEGTGKYKLSVCTNLPCALRNSRYTVDKPGPNTKRSSRTHHLTLHVIADDCWVAKHDNHEICCGQVHH